MFAHSGHELDGHAVTLWFWRCARADGSMLTSDGGFLSRIACEEDARKHGCTNGIALETRD